MPEKSQTKYLFNNIPEILLYIEQDENNGLELNYIENGLWKSYSKREFIAITKKLAIAFKTLKVKKGDKFSIMANSSPLWLAFDMASTSNSIVTVPIFANISKDNFEYEITESGVKYIFVDNILSWEIVKTFSKQFNLIITKNLDIDKNEHNNVISFEDFLDKSLSVSRGNVDSEYADLVKNINNKNLATIIYTSGSTGLPKGVEISHLNLVSQIHGALEFFPHKPELAKILTFLPLSHIFERMVSYYYLASGKKIYFADDVNKLGLLIKEIKPNMMTVVPRFIEKIYKKIEQNINEARFVKKLLGRIALKRANNRDFSSHKTFFDNFLDKLVYKKIINNFGGEIGYLVSGGAPLSKKLDLFFSNIGLTIYQGYGLTEFSPVISSNCPNAHKRNSVGTLFPEVSVKIADDGEILASGPALMVGYHKNEKQTEEVITKDGYLKTGDLGYLDEEGFLYITGRKKELFKTSTGKYVNPILIEQDLIRSKFVEHALIVADNRKFVSAILFLDFAVIEKFKNDNQLEKLSVREFLKHDILTSEIDKLINQVNEHLNPWERIAKYHISQSTLSISAGDITPSMKIRRSIVEKKYEKYIEDFYID